MVELATSVGTEAFLSLEQTYESEGLFAGDVWIAELEGAVAGFLALAEGEVTWMYVDPDCSRRGVGTALLRHALAHASDRVELTVLDGNTGALKLYEREGFVHASTTVGRLAGNEAFEATGHLLVWRRPPT